MAATTGQLGLVTPTQGTLSGTWGDTVNYGITEYVNIAIAGTLSFADDGAVTLANTTGSSSATNIGTTTAQYMVIRITGTQTVTKVITGPSYSKLYMVDHAGATSAVTFKASGQTGVSIAVGEKAFVYYNGTDYVKIASSTALTSAVSSFTAGTTGFTPSTTTTGAITLAGTLAVANGGTGLTTGTSGGVLAYTAAGTLASSGALAASALVIGGGAGAAPSTTTTATGALTLLGTPSSANLAALVTDETGSGVLVFGTSPTLGTPTVNGYTEGVVTANTTATYTISIASATVQILTLTANCTFTFPTATSGKSFMILLKQDAAGSRTATWPASVKWPASTAPTITSTASKGDKFVFTADGTYWWGSNAGQNYL